MAIKNETRILKTNTFEEWRQKDNEISLHVGDVHDFNSLIADKEFSTTASAGDYVFAGTRFEFSNENVLDNPNGYIILKNNPAIPSSYVVNATVSQTGGFTATIVGILGTKKIAVKNASGTFNASQKITVGSDDITAANVSRVVSESYPKAVIKVYKNGAEQSQSITAQGFHVINWQFTITLTGSPALPATFTEGATLYQGADLANATWQGTMYDITSTTIRLKTNVGSFNAGEILKVNGNTGASHQIAHAKISAGNAVDYSFGQLIELHTAVSAGDVIKIDASNAVDAINELQVDVGDVTVINNATGYSAASVVTGITEIQGDIGDITGLGTTVKSTLVGSINEIETAVRGSLGNYTLTTAQTAHGLIGAVNEIEAVFDASAYGISAGANSFDLVSGQFTLDSSADIVLNADSGNVILEDGLVQYGALTNASGNLIVKSGTTTMLTGSGANATFAGNTQINGTLEVDGTAGIDGDLRVGSNKFNVVAASGNTQIDGTLEVDGTLGVDGNFRVGSDKFNVTASSGNTQVDGTFNVDSTTTLNGTTIDGDLDLNGSVDVSTNAVIHGNIDVDGISNFDVVDIDGAVDMATTLGVTGNTTIGGILDVGQLNTKFTNRNNVKLALNELHDEVGVGGSAFSALANHSTSGQTNITSAVQAINTEIGDVSTANTILDHTGNHAHKSATVSGVLDNLSAAIVSNDTDISGNDADISTINTKLGTITAAGMGTSASSVSTAITELHGEINSNDTDITALQGNGSTTGRLRLDNTGTQTTAGNITFGGSKTIKIGSNATLDIDGTLIVGGAGGGSLTYETAFITIAGAANLEGLEIDRSAITGVTISPTEDAKFQWRESKVAAGGSNASHRAWQLKGFSNAATPLANTTDIVTFYNAKDLLKNQSAGTGSTEVYGEWTATTDSEGFNLHLNNSGVTAATYGSTTAIPEIAIDAKGRITSAVNRSIATALSISSDGGGDNTVELLTETLEISGGTNITTTTQTNGITANLDDNVDLAGTLDVTGVGTFDTNVLIHGQLNTRGDNFLGNGSGDDTTVSGDLNVSGDLSVAGTFTTTSTSDVAITDKNIKLGKGSTTSATNAGTGITFGDYAGAATFNYSHVGTKLVANKVIEATSFIGDLSGSATSLETSRTIAMTGDVAWTSDSFNGSGNVSGTSTIGDEKIFEKHLKSTANPTNGQVLSYNSTTTGFTWTTIGAGTTVGKTAATQRSGAVTIQGGTNITINESPSGTFEWVGQNDNTEYTAGRKLTLTGTRFDHDVVGTAGTTGQTGTADGTYVKSITVDSTGHVTATSSDDFDSRYIQSFQVEDGDGTEVTIGQGKEWKFVEGASSGGSNYININWSDTSTGSDADPYDLTFNHNNTTKTTTTTTAAPAYGATFTAIGGITTNVEGHVTNVETKTITIPATDNTNTTYTAGTGLSLSGTVFNANVHSTVQTNGPISPTSIAARSYPIQVDSSDNLLVNIPWTNTEYSVSSPITISGTLIGHKDVLTDNSGTAGTYGQSSTEDGKYIKSIKVTAEGHIEAITADDFDNRYAPFSSIFQFKNTATDSDPINIGTGNALILTGGGATTISHPTGSSNFTISSTNTWVANSKTVAGYVAAPGNVASKVWKTDGSGNPGWRDDTDTDTNTWIANAVGTAGYVAVPVANKVWKTNGIGQPAWRDDADTNTDTTYTAGTNVSISASNVISSTDTNTNTTYSAGTGLDLSGTTFSVESDLRGEVFQIGQSTSYYYLSTGNEHVWYNGGHIDMLLTSGGALHVENDITAFSTTISSDRKLKENIKVVDGALAKVCALEGVTFDWKKDGKASAGVIAQDVEKILPSAVSEVESLHDREDNHKVVDYNQMTALFIEAIKELKEENNQLRTMVENLKDINS